VGRRLALLARALAYGEPLVASGPTLASVEADGATMVLGFDNVGRGLVARKPGAEPDAAGEPSNFELAGADGVFHPARARIAGDRVRAESDTVPAPVRVRYAWAATPEPPVDFFNRDGLPASPFEAKVGAVPGRP
jgi:sialate O-acetylesterase